MADKNSNKTIRGQLTTAQRGLFFHTSALYNEGQRVASPYREMMIGQKMESGRHAKNVVSTNWYSDRRQMELPSNYSGKNAKIRDFTSHQKVTSGTWEATPSGLITVLTPKQFHQQLSVAAHQSVVALEHWKHVLSQRALAVFKESFKLKKFNSYGGEKWKRNTEWTVKKRKWKGTWPGANKLMQETNALYNSLKTEAKNGVYSVVTGVRYAGIHNDPEPGWTYGDGFGGKYSPPKPVTKRQFMGHSTKIDQFIRMYERRYLFDTVFRKPV